MKIKPGSFLIGCGITAAGMGLFLHLEPMALSIIPLIVGGIMIIVGVDEV